MRKVGVSIITHYIFIVAGHDRWKCFVKYSTRKASNANSGPRTLTAHTKRSVADVKAQLTTGIYEFPDGMPKDDP